jgi:hypothetical protein
MPEGRSGGGGWRAENGGSVNWAFMPPMLDPKLPRAAIDVAILAHMYCESENPYEFLYRLWASLDGGARVAVVDMDKRTEHHGTLPALLRCEMAAVGFRQVDFTELAPADGYLAVFAPPEALPAIATIKPCRP